MSSQEAIRSYEDFLLGKKKLTLKSPYNIGKEKNPKDAGTEDRKDTDMDMERAAASGTAKTKAKEQDAFAIVRYGVKNVLGWSPQDAVDHITPEIAKELGFDILAAKYVEFPKDLDNRKDYDWLVHMAFPSETKYDMEKDILELYRKVLAGEIKAFPRRTFKGENGRYKLTVLLNDYISKNIPFTDTESLYRIFGNTARGNETLKKAKLYYAYVDMYNSPLDYLHDTLGQARDWFLYNYYRYMDAYAAAEREHSAA